MYQTKPTINFQKQPKRTSSKTKKLKNKKANKKHKEIFTVLTKINIQTIKHDKNHE